MTLEQINFTVDAELLRELGERLVGRPYIALAELVKNGFDADATVVEIRIDDDSIQVSDNGHGMTRRDFVDRWMRVGSTHKMRDKHSPVLKRPFTGSKGVGRLAAQFLASELELISSPGLAWDSDDDWGYELYAHVDWENAVKAGELTEATASYEFRESKDGLFPLESSHGMTVTLNRLKHAWTAKEFEDLAREIWFLQAPFRSLVREAQESDSGFEVRLFAADVAAVSRFEAQMARILDLYRSRLVGKLIRWNESISSSARCQVALSLDLEGHTQSSHLYEIPLRGDWPCLINAFEFEIRIYDLRYRQPYGIPVQQARDYMNEWGGIHIYDAGFRIPYAGPSADWLNLELAHSHRVERFKTLTRLPTRAGGIDPFAD